jgi:hypothetical protein
VKRLGLRWGKNYQKDAQKKKISLDFLVLLHQGKRTENIILRITIPKEKPRIKPRIAALQHRSI